MIQNIVFFEKKQEIKISWILCVCVCTMYIFKRKDKVTQLLLDQEIQGRTSLNGIRENRKEHFGNPLNFNAFSPWMLQSSDSFEERYCGCFFHSGCNCCYYHLGLPLADPWKMLFQV